MDWSSQLTALATLSERAAVASEGDGTARIEHCPDWSLDELIAHLAQVQWFWANTVGHRITDPEQVIRPPALPDGETPTTWLRSQSALLTEALGSVGAREPIWTWFDPDQTAGFVLRRQLIEAAIHCFDAEQAAQIMWTVPGDVADLGLHEFVEVMQREIVEGASPRPLRLESTDTKWTGTLFPSDSKPAVTFRSSAAHLLLALWGRTDVPTDVGEIISAVGLG
jgi:uncharacterized protein (TIGR03083 family)